VADEALRVVASRRPSLTSLDVMGCALLTDSGVRAVSCLPALTLLDASLCFKVTAAGVQALRDATAAPELRIEWSEPSAPEDHVDHEEDDDADGEEEEEVAVGEEAEEPAVGEEAEEPAVGEEADVAIGEEQEPAP